MKYRLDELAVIQQLEQAESARRVKHAYMEGLFAGLEKSKMLDGEHVVMWEMSKAKAGLLDDDITIPLDITEWENNE